MRDECLIETKQVLLARADWLKLGGDYPIIFTPEHRAANETLKIDHFFLFIVTDKVVFGTIYSTCVIYTNNYGGG